MKINVNELQGAALDRTVAKCKGIEVVAMKEGRATFSDPTDDGALNEMPINYSTDWSQGGPIIEREKIDLFTEKGSPESWVASVAQYQNGMRLVGWRLHQYGPTPLVAAMRCYVASKLGDEIDLPADLALDCLIYETGDE